MRRIRTTLTALLAVTASALVGVEAQAAHGVTAASETSATAAPRRLPTASLRVGARARRRMHCRWNGENANWAGCRNRVSDVWNNGFPGRREDVRLFYGLAMTGSWAGASSRASPSRTSTPRAPSSPLPAAARASG